LILASNTRKQSAIWARSRLGSLLNPARGIPRGNLQFFHAELHLSGIFPDTAAHRTTLTRSVSPWQPQMAPIKYIEYFRVPPRWLFVKITDVDGYFGWGEASLEGHTEAVEGCLDAFTERFVGLDAE
jgi:hypothetical protein